MRCFLGWIDMRAKNEEPRAGRSLARKPRFGGQSTSGCRPQRPRRGCRPGSGSPRAPYNQSSQLPVRSCDACPLSARWCIQRPKPGYGSHGQVAATPRQALASAIGSCRVGRRGLARSAIIRNRRPGLTKRMQPATRVWGNDAPERRPGTLLPISPLPVRPGPLVKPRRRLPLSDYSDLHRSVRLVHSRDKRILCHSGRPPLNPGARPFTPISKNLALRKNSGFKHLVSQRPGATLPGDLHPPG